MKTARTILLTIAAILTGCVQHSPSAKVSTVINVSLTTPSYALQ